MARTCAGISEAQARTVLIDLHPDVDRVEAVRERTNTKLFVERPVGADVHVRATPGMTAQWLTRLIQCHLVREESGVSYAHSERPLGLARVKIDVSPTAAGFVIAIRSNDSDVAREIARRSKVLFEPAGAAGESRGAALQRHIDSKAALADQNP